MTITVNSQLAFNDNDEDNEDSNDNLMITPIKDRRLNFPSSIVIKF